jgi:mxaJ protein
MRTLALIILLIFCQAQFALSQGTWEMRVCASPHSMPASSKEEPGYDNLIAEILASELDATLTFEWTLFDDESIRRTLLAGECDVAIGVAEGAAGLLSTVPYLRTPYVFVWRSDAGVDVETLDDDVLETLRIGTYQTGIPSIALGNRGLQRNLIEYPPVASRGGPDRHGPILDAVVRGEVDLGVVYGPAAALWGARYPRLLVYRPVLPEFDVGASLLQYFRTWTIGVRPHDEALRDRLNVALASRWDEIQAAITAFGVPQLHLTRPTSVGEKDHPSRIRVGVIAPSESGGQVPLSIIGEGARLGASLAENELARGPVQPGTIEVLFASAPTDEAAVRAAGRLVSTEAVDALVGGFGFDQAVALAQIVERQQVLLFNTSAIADELRGSVCSPFVFHVQASASMYIDATVQWFSRAGHVRWFVVHEDTAEGIRLLERTRQSLERSAVDAASRAASRVAAVVGAAATEPGQFLYLEVIELAEAAGADVILLLLRTGDQELFLSQYPSSSSAAVVGLPFPLAQTREYLYRFRDVSPSAGLTPRPALWEASLVEGGAGDLNQVFLARTGLALEGTGWATYASIMMLAAAAEAGAAGDSNAIVDYLTDPATTFDLGKGVMAFRVSDRQLLQPLYMVEADGDAAWARTGLRKVALARALGTVLPPESAALAQAPSTDCSY